MYVKNYLYFIETLEIDIYLGSKKGITEIVKEPNMM